MSLLNKILFGSAGVCLLAGLGWWLFAPGRNREDVVYGRGGDITLTLDLDYPEQVRSAYPAILFLHPDGDWIRLQKKNERFATILRTFNEAGYLVASVHYRVEKEATFPGPVEDCKAAVRWLRANAHAWSIEPDHLGVIGVATGGYLAAMLGTTDSSHGFDGVGGNAGVSGGVQAVVSIDAPLDFTKKSWPDAFEEKVLAPFLGASYEANPAVYRQATPGTYASPDDPPFLLMHSRGNQVNPVAQSRLLAEKLKQAGASVRLVEVDNNLSLWKGPHFREAVDRARAFFDQQLGNTKP
jgi:acetyl esterase/lipase